MMKIAHTLPLALTLLLGAVPAVRAASPETSEQFAAAAVEQANPGTEISRAKDGMFYVTAEINGHKVRFLIDTGANVVTLTGADAARLGIEAEESLFGPQMSTAGGRVPMAWAKLDNVRLAGREVRGVKAAVMRTGLPVSLLGQNMLSQLASVTIEGDRLRMR